MPAPYGIQAVPGQLAAALPPASPLAEPTLLVDSEREILHTSVLSEVTPGYASNGRALISTSVLGTGSGSLEPAVRGRLATLYGVGTADWENLATYTIEGALPAMAAPHPLIRGGVAASARAVTSAVITGPPGPSRARWPPGLAPPARS